MKTLLLALVTLVTLGYTAPNAEARDGDRHRRYYHSNHYNGDRYRVVYRRGYPRYYYTSDYGYRSYPYRVYPRRYYRPAGVSFFIRF